MKRRDFLRVAGLGSLSVASFSFPMGWAAQTPRKGKVHVLFFTKSSGFEHSVIRRKGGQLSHAEQVLTELGEKHGFQVTATKDGTVFDSDLDRFDVIFFYTTGDLTQPGTDRQPPMSPKGKEALLQAIAAGKGFVGAHCASDTFHSPGKPHENQPLDQQDPYIRMLGGEFISHGIQQEAEQLVVDRHFPGCEDLGPSFRLMEEWYALKNFARDLHVILVQKTDGMVGPMYHRPPFPSTWARRHERGRVFYTSMGHREDVWTNPIFQKILLGGISWAARQVEATVTPNLEQVAPHADQLGPA
jgi:type 1 glutamine amidotransferase